MHYNTSVVNRKEALTSYPSYKLEVAIAPLSGVAAQRVWQDE